MLEPRPSLASVAAIIAKGSSPEWLLEELARFAPLIGWPRNPPDDLSPAMAAIDCLENELVMYATAAERFDLELPDCIDAASTALVGLREFFEEQRRPARKGGPTPDGRRKLCAGVCASAWRRLHDKVEPYSQKLQAACEEYWQACGQSETSTMGRLKNWQPFLVEAAGEADTP
jgi:hypothetical protein